MKNYGECSWYDAPLDRMPKRFGLVVCDGLPKRTTPCDRYGLLPVARDRLGGGCVVLLDDVDVQGQDQIVSGWLQERRASCRVSASRPSDSYAVITLE